MFLAQSFQLSELESYTQILSSHRFHLHVITNVTADLCIITQYINSPVAKKRKVTANLSPRNCLAHIGVLT